MTDATEATLTLAEAARRIYRTLEMSAGIMRDPGRTGGWEGSERTASAFERQAIAAKSLHTRLAALASTPAGDGVEEAEALGWLVEWTVAGQDWVEAFACEVNAVDKARAKNGKCTPLYAALARPRAAVGEREAAEVARKMWNAWTAEDMSGDDVMALYGTSLRDALALQSPPAKVEPCTCERARARGVEMTCFSCDKSAPPAKVEGEV